MPSINSTEEFVSLADTALISPAVPGYGREGEKETRARGIGRGEVGCFQDDGDPGWSWQPDS